MALSSISRCNQAITSRKTLADRYKQARMLITCPTLTGIDRPKPVTRKPASSVASDLLYVRPMFDHPAYLVLELPKSIGARVLDIRRRYDSHLAAFHPKRTSRRTGLRHISDGRRRPKPTFSGMTNPLRGKTNRFESAWATSGKARVAAAFSVLLRETYGLPTTSKVKLPGSISGQPRAFFLVPGVAAARYRRCVLGSSASVRALTCVGTVAVTV